MSMYEKYLKDSGRLTELKRIRENQENEKNKFRESLPGDWERQRKLYEKEYLERRKQNRKFWKAKPFKIKLDFIQQPDKGQEVSMQHAEEILNINNYDYGDYTPDNIHYGKGGRFSTSFGSVSSK